MRKLFSFIVLAVLLTGAACNRADQTPRADVKPPAVQATKAVSFQALPYASQIFVMTRSNKSVPVRATFNIKSGQLDVAGTPAARMVVDVTSYYSGLLERDNNVKDIFFGATTAGHEEITLTLDRIDPTVWKNFAATGNAQNVVVSAQVSFAESTMSVPVVVNLTVTPEGRLQVKSAKTVEISIAHLGLQNNLKELMATYGSGNVDDIVQVEFVLDFDGIK